jgi:hypothetical protein
MNVVLAVSGGIAAYKAPEGQAQPAGAVARVAAPMCGDGAPEGVAA